ncbi:histidine phosphatase family protein [Streptomyces canus]|uniref:histidine phosphatase family protein n=2 Tax=Streptomyces TaxID=1883 RepID=UPI00386C774D|nr:histidine phosphatase family protein [Streptomyces canus]
MTVRLTLLCAAARTERAVRFADAPLDERALRRAEAVAATLPQAGTVYTAPSPRCTGTAEALGWEAVTAQPALRDLDMGSWYGRTLDEIAATDASGLAGWLTDPEAAPHGGESVQQICDRVAAWLDALPSDAGRVLAVVEQAVARAAVVHALGAPRQAFWRIDVPPLSTVDLTGRDGRWNLRMAELPLGPRPPR